MPRGQLEFFVPGCVSMGLENGTILTGLIDENYNPY